ncbi:hypothetical protein [Geodermatophilus maliterrae]|uniref:Cytochrome P450 n=1 Tax=Geodermatophilus maliterrae TaxID=3162531 RepID=A0ABV3XAD0_9ACTN
MTTEAPDSATRAPGPPTGSPARVLLPDGQPVWIVRRGPDVAALRHDPRLATAPPDQGSPRRASDHLTRWRHEDCADSPEGRRVHRLLGTLDVACLRRPVGESVQRCLDEVETAGPPADLGRLLVLPTTADVSCHLLGVPRDDRPQFGAWLRESFATAGGGTRRRTWNREELLGYLCELVETTVRMPGEGLLGRLVETARDDGERLSELALVHAAQLVLTEVYERVAGLVVAALVPVLSDATPCAATDSAGALLPPAVDEVLGLHASWCSGITVRYARADIPLQGTVIPRGARVLLDDRAAEGVAVRDCAGSALARLVVVVARTALRERFAVARLVGPTPRPPRHRTGGGAGSADVLLSW